jgi:hypothetical protein
MVYCHDCARQLAEITAAWHKAVKVGGIRGEVCGAGDVDSCDSQSPDSTE